MGPAPQEKARGPGRPRLPRAVMVRISEEDKKLAYKLTGFPVSTPFRVVFQALISKAEVAQKT